MIVQIQDYKWLQCKIFRHMQDTLQTHKRKLIISVGTFSNMHDCTLINKYIAKVSSTYVERKCEPYLKFVAIH